MFARDFRKNGVNPLSTYLKCYKVSIACLLYTWGSFGFSSDLFVVFLGRSEPEPGFLGFLYVGHHQSECTQE